MKKIIRIVSFFLASFLSVFFMMTLSAITDLSAAETDSASEFDIEGISLTDLLNAEISVAGKKSQAISESAGIISVLTAKDIERLGVLNLVDVFSYIPGFTVTDNYWNREIVTAREVFQALYNDKLLLLIDGIPAYEAINTEYYLDLIPIEAVKRIEIIRGPGSTLYGTNAFAGVINVITRRGSDFPGVEVKATAGAFGFYERTVTAGTSKDHLDLFFSGSIRSDNGYDHLIPFDESGNVNIGQSYRKEFKRAHFRMKWKSVALSFQFLDYDYEHFGLVPYQWAQGRVKHNTFNASLSYTKKFSDKLSTTNSIRYMKQTRDNEAGIFGTLFPGSDTRVDGKKAEAPTFIDWKGAIYQFESQWNYTFDKKFSLVSGVAMERRVPYNITTVYDGWGLKEEERIVGMEGSYTYPPKKDQVDYGFYFQGDLRLKHVAIVGGIRYAYMGVAEKSMVAPRVALIVNLARQLNLKALYGMAFRSPTIYESEVFIKNVLFGGKTAIKPEKVSTYEMGLDYVGKTFGARVNYYYMTIDDIIARRGLTVSEKNELNATGGDIYDNINNQKLSGIEFEIKAYPIKQLSLFLNGSFRIGEDRNSGKSIDYVAKTLFSGGFGWKIPALNIEISPNFFYVGKRRGVALDGNTYIFDGYFLVNLRAGITFSDQFSINLIGKNLTDKSYFYPEMTRNRVGIKLPGGIPRSFFIQAAFRFGK